MDSAVLPAGGTVSSDLWGRHGLHFPYWLEWHWAHITDRQHMRVPCRPISGQLRGVVSPQAPQDFSRDTWVSVSAERSLGFLGLTGILASGQHRAASTLMRAGFPDDPGNVRRRKWWKFRSLEKLPVCKMTAVFRRPRGLGVERWVFSQFYVQCRQCPGYFFGCGVHFSQHCLLQGCPSPRWVLHPFLIN